MTEKLMYCRWGVAEFREQLPALRKLYAAAFAEWPYLEGLSGYVAAFEESAWRNVAQPGFACVAAVERGAIVGFSYGYRVPETWWFHRAGDLAPVEVKAAEKFFVVEWAVLGEYRQRGVGKELMRLLLESRAEAYAVLVVNPLARAREVYAASGWRAVGRTGAEGIWPVMTIMVRSL